MGEYKRWISGEARKLLITDALNALEIELLSMKFAHKYWYVKVHCSRSAIRKLDLKFSGWGIEITNKRPNSEPIPKGNSRKRGYRFEAWLVKFFEKKEIPVKRIPLSGAPKGYSGDLNILVENEWLIIEAKMTLRGEGIQLNAKALNTLHDKGADVIIFRQGPSRGNAFATIPLVSGKLNFLDYLSLCENRVHAQVKDLKGGELDE